MFEPDDSSPFALNSSKGKRLCSSTNITWITHSDQDYLQLAWLGTLLAADHTQV
jgi:hypothetical protein